MRKWLFVGLLLCLGAALPTSAQTLTQVSATITDPNGLPYSNATIQIQLAGGGSTPQTTPCAASPCYVTNPPPFQTDASGKFAYALYANASITPGGTTWQFNVLEPGVPPPWGYGSKSFRVSLPTSGATDDISSSLSAAAPALTPNFSGGGGPPSGPAGGDLSGTYPNPTVSGIKGVAVPTLAPGYLYYSGSAYAWQTPSGGGTVTSFSAGTLSPLFSTSVATPTTTPALTFTLSNAGADTLFGNPTSGSAAPSFITVLSPLGFDGTHLTCSTCGSGSGVSSFSGDGTLANNASSTGAVTLSLANTGVGYGVWGNTGSSSGAPAYHAMSSYPAAAFPTLNQSTTGNAATATNLATYPSLCSGGQFSEGYSSGAPPTNNCATPSGAGFSNPMTTLGDMIYGGASGAATRLPGPTTDASTPYMLTSTPNSSNVAQAEAWAPAGIPIDSQSSASITVAGAGTKTDRASLIISTNNTTSTATSIAAAGSSGFDLNYFFGLCNEGSVVNTLTPATSAINGNATLKLLGFTSGGNPECAFGYSDNTNYWAAEILPTDANGKLQVGAESANTVTATSAASAAKQLCTSGGATKTCSYIDFPDAKTYPSANCVSTVAGSAWSTTLSPACRTGTNNLGGNLPFADASTAQFEAEIPADWDSSIDPYVNLFFTTGANTSGTIIFEVQVSCYSSTNAETDDQSFETAQVFATVTAAAANYGNSESLQLNSTSMTGCRAGGSMILKVTRNTDTASSTVPVTKMVVTTPRLLAVQAE